MTKKWLLLFLKVAVSAGLIWYLFNSIDLVAAQQRLSKVDPMMLLLAAGMLLFQMVIGALRWSAVLRGIGISIPFQEITRLFYIGSFFNQALPGGTGGDVVRIYLVFKSNWGFRGAVNGVVLERAATLLALIILVLGTLPFFLTNLDGDERAWVIPSLVLLSILTVSGVCLLCLFDRLPRGLYRWRMVRGLGNLAQDSRAVFLKANVAVVAIFWSAAGHINVAIAVYVLSRGLGLEFTMFESIVLMPPVLLVMTIPISVGAWGVRENAMVVAFGLIGISAEAATLLGLLLGLASLVVALPGGLLWFSGRKEGTPSLSTVQAELAVVEPKQE